MLLGLTLVANLDLLELMLTASCMKYDNTYELCGCETASVRLNVQPKAACEPQALKAKASKAELKMLTVVVACTLTKLEFTLYYLFHPLYI